MRAIEINSRTDKTGLLKLNCRLHRADSKVRVILLLEESDEDDQDGQLWLRAAANNPAFDFLKDPEEDIYTLSHGEPLND